MLQFQASILVNVLPKSSLWKKAKLPRSFSSASRQIKEVIFWYFFCSVKWNNQTNKKFNKILRVANKWKKNISSSYRNLKESMMMKKQWLWLENQVTCPVPVSLCLILCSMIWTEGGRGTRNRCEDLKKKIPPPQKLETYIYYILFDSIETKTSHLFRKTQIHCYLHRNKI